MNQLTGARKPALRHCGDAPPERIFHAAIELGERFPEQASFARILGERHDLAFAVT
jgi:hypothetical protein